MPKTWAAGDVLTAAEINNNLNPATAPNIPYAVAAGQVTINPGATTNISALMTVSFPAGRFSKPPIVNTTFIATAGTYKVTLRVQNVSATSFQVVMLTTDGAGFGFSGSLGAGWIAVQMAA